MPGARSVRLHDTAIEDVKAIFDYLAERIGEDRAEQYTMRIEAFCRSLGTFSERGPLRTDLGEGIRAIVFESRAVIAYRIDESGVFVLRVIHGGQGYDKDAMP